MTPNEKIENALSVSKIGLQIKSWAILSEIVYIFRIYIVSGLNNIFLFFIADFGLRSRRCKTPLRLMSLGLIGLEFMRAWLTGSKVKSSRVKGLQIKGLSYFWDLQVKN